MAAGGSMELARLVVNMVGQKSELDKAIEDVHRKLKEAQAVGKQAILDPHVMSKAKTAADFLVGSLGAVVKRLLAMVGASTAAVGGTVALGPAVTAVAGEMALLGVAIGAAAVVIGALIAVLALVTKKFIEWQDSMIRAKSILHAFGGGSDSEIAHMEAALKKMSIATAESVGRLREIYVELRKVTDEASALKIMNQSLALAAISKQAPESIAELIGRIQNLGRDGEASLMQLRRLFSQLGPEFPDHARQIRTVGQALDFIHERAQKGAIAQAEQMGMLSMQWKGFKNELNAALTELGKIAGPPIVGALLGLLDAFKDLIEIVKIFAKAFEITAESADGLRDAFRLFTHMMLIPVIGFFKVLASAVLAVKIALEGLTWVVMKLGQVGAWLFGNDELGKNLAKGAEIMSGMLQDDMEAIKKIWQVGSDPLAFLKDKGKKAAGLDVSGILEAKGQVWQKPEFSSLGEFWKKAQMNIFNSGVFDPGKAHREAMGKQDKSLELQHKMLEALQSKLPRPAAVAG